MDALNQALALMLSGRDNAAAAAFERAFTQEPALFRVFRANYEVLAKRLTFPSLLNGSLGCRSHEFSAAPDMLNGDFALPCVPALDAGQVAHHSPIANEDIFGSSTSAGNFGAALLGPLFLNFFRSLRTYIKTEGISTLFFLSREGWYLQYAFDCLCRAGKMPAAKSTYLLASRNFLFKLGLGSSDVRQIALSTPYSGLVKAFLRDRLGLTSEEIESINSLSADHHNVLNTYLDLPIDIAAIDQFLEVTYEHLKPAIDRKKKIYLTYLQQVGFLDENQKIPHLVDIGYSGTIQRCLYNITTHSSVGHYFFTTDKAHQDPTLRAIGHLLSHINFGSGNPLIDKSLYLEALLTAPHGRVIDIRSDDQKIEFVPDFHSFSLARSVYLDEIIRGAIGYVIDNIDSPFSLTSDDVGNIYAALIQSARTRASEFSHLFELDDFINGNGEVNVIKKLGG